MKLFQSKSSKEGVSEETKKCGECLVDIPKKAKKCSHCGSKQKQEYTAKHLLVVLVIVIFIAIIFGSGGSDSPTLVPTAQNNTLSLSEDGILNNNKISTDCSGATSLGTTKENYSSLIEAITMDDKLGYSRMLGEGEAYLVDNCTKIKKIGGSFTMAEVRILEGKYIGESGWTAFEFAVKQ